MRSMQVSDYMNRHPVIFSKEMPVEEAVSRLISAKQGGGPVVDEAGIVIGFLSEQDCLKMMLKGAYHKEQSATVEDCMSPHAPVMVYEDKAIVDLAQELGADRPKLYPVIDYDKRLIGVISRTDILRAIDLHFKDSFTKP